MRRSLFFLFFALIVFPLALSAQQQSNATNPLNDQQTMGRRVFRQRCAVCHLPPVPGAKVYGPSLFKQLIVGNEDSIRDIIMNGSKGKMPGFKYGLDRDEIDAIISYLATVEKPQTSKPGTPGAPIVND